MSSRSWIPYKEQSRRMGDAISRLEAAAGTDICTLIGMFEAGYKLKKPSGKKMSKEEFIGSFNRGGEAI